MGAAFAFLAGALYCIAWRRDGWARNEKFSFFHIAVGAFAGGFMSCFYHAIAILLYTHGDDSSLTSLPVFLPLSSQSLHREVRYLVFLVNHHAPVYMGELEKQKVVKGILPHIT